MDIKVEIKEEPCFQDFSSENEGVIVDLVKKVKVETSNRDIKPELEDSKCFSLNEEYHLMSFNEAVTESEIETKIDIKEENWRLEREDLCVHDNIKNETQEDTHATKPPSLYKEEVSTYTSDLSSTENLENDVGFNMNVANAECGSDRKCQDEETVVADICSIETETSDDGTIVSMASCLKQSKLLQQCNTNKQDINEKKCVKNSFHLKNCRLAFDTKKVDKCGILKKSLYQLSPKTHKCNICNKDFTLSTNLKRHTLIHEGIKSHICNICNKGFSTSSGLKVHKLIHEGIKPYKCTICSKAFTQESHLKRHKLIHERIKPYKCNICNKDFSKLTYLKRHTLIIEGIKPHKCDICNKAFTKVSYLKRHKLSHEGIKPHKCNNCNQAFIHLSDLKRHTLIHEGKRQHKCHICNKAFSRLSDVKKHSLIHEGIKPHKCNTCNKAFTQLSHLKKHKLIHDGISQHK